MSWFSRRIRMSFLKNLSTLVLACCLIFCINSYAESNTQRPLTFIQMTDPQLGMTKFSEDVENFKQSVDLANKIDAEMVIICGDLVNKISLEAYQEFNRIKSGLKKPCYCVPGNHDINNASSVINYRKECGADYYYREINGCAFVFINSAIIKNPIEPYSKEQENWLNKTLAVFNSKNLPVIIVMHHPLFIDKFDEPDAYFNFPRNERVRLFNLFKASGVIAVLHGHTHRTSNIEYDGIIFASCETTSKNFDGKPLGFRIWKINDGVMKSEFMPLPAKPLNNNSAQSPQISSATAKK